MQCAPLVNDGAQLIFARQNWWGYDDSASVAQRIFDFEDDSTKGIVEYMPFAIGYVCGDFNGDGSDPNVSDLTYIIDYVFRQGAPPPQPLNSDINNDGQINVSDLTYLIAYLFYNGPDPVCI